MGVVVATDAADTRVSAAAPAEAELVVATVEPGLAGRVAAMARSITHPEFQRNATAATAAPDEGPTPREARLEATFMVLARDRKAEPLRSSLRGRQITPAAITFRAINPRLALRVNPVSDPVIIRAQNRMCASNAAA